MHKISGLLIFIVQLNHSFSMDAFLSHNNWAEHVEELSVGMLVIES